MVQSNPLAIGLKESWEGMLQTAHFAHVTGCHNADPACLRRLTMEQINEAVADTPNIVNPEHLLVAAMPFGPIIDYVNFIEQPFHTLLNGRYNKDINVIVGATQESFEIERVVCLASTAVVNVFDKRDKA